MTEKVRGYAVCTTPRSGSNYLCELLASTGMLGHPIEYFNPAALRLRALPEFADDHEGRLKQALAPGSTANGVYGLKVFVQHFDEMARTHWISRLPNLAFVHLTREDLLGQAISLVRADQTRQYRSTHSPVGPISYNARAIEVRLSELAVADARWRVFFARNQVGPLQLSYERIVENPSAAVDAIAARMGLGGEVEIDPAGISVEIQRDAESLAWRERFLRERGDLGYLDRPGSASFLTSLRMIVDRLRG